MNPSDNNSFGMQNAGGQGTMPTMQMPSADREDIVLPSSGKKGGKKWIFVVLGVVVVVALVALGVWMMTRGGGEERTTAQKEFNEYANYILYEEDSTNSVDEFETAAWYAIDENADNVVFLEEALSRYNSFYSIASNELSKYEGAGLMQTLYDYDFLLKYSELTFLDSGALLNVYIDSGEQSALEYLNNLYATYVSEDEANNLISAFGSYEIAYGENLIAYWNVYKANGCMVDDGFSVECIENLPMDTIRDVAAEIGATESTINAMYDNAIMDIKTNCNNIIKIFSGEQLVVDTEADDENNE